MKGVKFVIVLLLTTQTIFAQKIKPHLVNEYAGVDEKALRIPDSLTKTTEGIAKFITSNFSTDNERARAIFIWVATNIEYDIDNMFAINFYEEKKEKIVRSLKSRKGICENYAALFNEICTKAGIKSFVIEGYTKQNGFTDYIPHAWCAALVDNSWFMFDPTWGAGYVNGGKFYSKINNSYFKVSPSIFIKSHMPFDYLWQFVDYPVSSQEFYDGKTQQNKEKAFFNFSDSINLYEKQSHAEQLVSAARRIEKNRVKNSLIFDRLRHIQLEAENDKRVQEHLKQTESIALFNSAVVAYNEGISLFNEFIQYRNKQFLPKKTDAEIQEMVDTISLSFEEAKTNLSKIKDADANTVSLINKLNKMLDEVGSQLKEQQNWLKTYFSKGKLARKSMFYKYTWFGIPLN